MFYLSVRGRSFDMSLKFYNCKKSKSISIFSFHEDISDRTKLIKMFKQRFSFAVSKL